MTGTARPGYRWGIAGTGAMAAAMVRTLRIVEGAELVGVASRTAERAAAFARAAGAARGHSSYRALVEDPAVDIVHVATPVAQHVEVACAALAAGKHVLVEKPFALDAAGARQVAEAARAVGRFCMEAMWVRFLPAVDLLLRDAAALDPRLLVASVGFEQTRPAEDLLLDLGVYPLSLAHLLLGAPRELLASSVHEGLSTMTLAHEGGAVSQLSVASTAGLDNRLVLSGRSGRLELTGLLAADRVAAVRPRPVPPMSAEIEPLGLRERMRSAALASRGAAPLRRAVRRATGEVRTRREPLEGPGYLYEVRAVHRAIAEGRLECDRMPLADSVAVLETVDAVRRGDR